MLRIDSVEVKDFGPYRGRQTIEFAGNNGVIIVSGENMRGKTTLLNALRFGLFGRVLGRSEKEQELPRLLNVLARRDGERSFAVTLRVQHDGIPLEIIRTCIVNEGGESGPPDVETIVLRSGTPLSKVDGDLLLKTLMPEGIARFFLFDGELLQQYELLLDDDSAIGQRITEAIEQILGVPILLRLRTDLDLLRQRATDAEARALQRDKRTERLGQQLENSRRLCDECRAEVQRQDADVQRLQTEAETLEERLNRSTKLLNLIGEKRELQRQVTQRQVECENAQNRLSILLENAWHWPLLAPLDKLRDQVTTTVVEAEAVRRNAQREALLSELRQQCASGTCPICEQNVKQSPNPSPGAPASNDGEAAHAAAVASLTRLNAIQLSRDANAAVEVFKQISGTTAEIAQLQNRLSDLDEQIGGGDETGLVDAQRRWKTVQDALAHARIALSTAKQKLSEQEAAIKRLQDQIRGAVGPTVGAETRKREYVETLRDIVQQAVERYRESLKVQVEHDASELFRAMTTEPEYERLSITPSYGLRIVHKDGTEVPLRSSGAEHVVALSLVGALQKNAPVRGPLFIDSPFGRLDAGHKERVVRALPTMADQVVLLVYKTEIDEDVVRHALAGRLLCEYELVRISARETQIEQRRAR